MDFGLLFQMAPGSLNRAFRLNLNSPIQNIGITHLFSGTAFVCWLFFRAPFFSDFSGRSFASKPNSASKNRSHRSRNSFLFCFCAFKIHFLLLSTGMWGTALWIFQQTCRSGTTAVQQV
jgi:hypothetical protein